MSCVSTLALDTAAGLDVRSGPPAYIIYSLGPFSLQFMVLNPFSVCFSMHSGFWKAGEGKAQGRLYIRVSKST